LSKSRPNFLSIGDVARITGVGEATLRAWERRFGFPEPERRESGHRRYGPEQVEQILLVLAERQRGVVLASAIERARGPRRAVRSLYAALRERRPELAPVTLDKRHMLALTRAIEDESVARAEPTILIGAFQRERYFRRGEHRWRDLAGGEELSFALADFEQLRTPPGAAAEIPLAGTHPNTREWALVVAAAQHRACLVGWETPIHEEQPPPEAERRFEALFSVDPEVVREAVAAAATIAEPAAPEIAALTRRRLADLVDPSPAAQLRLAAAITTRLLARLA
jgi:MerR family transcriptional regulator, light-induced transcriptional regulator